MRARITVSALLGLLALGYLVTHLVFFVQLFFDHSGVAITQDEIASAHTATDARPQLIPKIIHQVYHDWNAEQNGGNETMPTDWDEVRHTCIDKNEDWTYMLWTASTSREFIQRYYPWFLSTYDNYKLPIQRVDSVRYFLMLHYGGIYIDLDNGCLENLTPLLYYPTWTTDGGRGALSNNILASVPNHPFWKLLTDSLIPYNYNYFFPYVTISYASGQWFETAIWQKYHSQHPEERLHRIMMDDRPGTQPWIYFTQERGGTWKNWDNAFFLWIGDHLALLALVVVSGLALLWWSVRRCLSVHKKYSEISTGKIDIEHGE